MTSREELYQLVWSAPMSKAADHFGVSGSYLARVCTILNVPRPQRGYWAKLAVGKAPPALLLPKRALVIRHPGQRAVSSRRRPGCGDYRHLARMRKCVSRRTKRMPY